MGTEKIRCQKCGRDFDPRGLAKHQPTCNGPDGGKTGPRCPVCGKRAKNERGLNCHYAQTGHGDKGGSQEPVASSQEKQQKPAAGLPPKPATGYRLPATASPPDGIAEIGHAFMRLADLLGLLPGVADCPHPDGHLFLNTANGKAAIVGPDGSIQAAEVIAR